MSRGSSMSGSEACSSRQLMACSSVPLLWCSALVALHTMQKTTSQADPHFGHFTTMPCLNPLRRTIVEDYVGGS